MNKIISTIGFLTFFVMSAASADPGKQYLLPKLGIMSIDVFDAKLLYSLGFQYGYGLTRNVSFEADLNYGFIGGEYKKLQEEGDFRVFSLGAYGAYRLPLTKALYLKGKLGGIYEDVERSSNLNAGSDEIVSIAGGLGAGYYYGELGPVRLTVELEWTKLDKDINFYSMGAHLAF